MALQVWFLGAIGDELQRQAEIASVRDYGNFGNGNILTGVLRKDGVLSHLGRYFALGHIKFWKPKGAENIDVRIPFVRVDNHFGYSGGIALTPIDGISVRYHNRRHTIGETEQFHKQTIDESTPLHRVQLVSVQDGDFMGRVFATWDNNVLVPKGLTQNKVIKFI